MEMKSGIYMWTSPSGKSYIGQSVNLQKRKCAFLRFGDIYGGQKINRARKKYNNKRYWKYKVLEYCDIDDLDEREEYYISLYNTMRKGYNCESGGNENKIVSDESKQKMSEAKKGNHLTEEQKRKMSEARKGENNPMWGKHFTEEQKRKMSDKKKGLYDGAKHPRAYPIVQLTLDGEFIKEYGCAKEAANELGINRRGIGRCVSGKLTKSHGFKWMKATDYYANHTSKNPPLLNKNEGLNKN